ncbi:MAG: bifunctional lysylphosphatidylglycerol flippase/synthetase MprF [Vicinamibacteria bacterium]
MSEDRARRWLPAAAGLALFAAALFVLESELRRIRYDELTARLFELPPRNVLLALLATAVNYLVLAGYDLLAFAYIGKTLQRAKIVLTAFVAYAVANNVGFAMFSGAAVRYRFYSRWGVGAADLTRLFASYSVTFWLGLLVLGGGSLALWPPPVTLGLPAEGALRVVGLLLLLPAAAYAALPFLRRGPLRVLRFELPVPSRSIVARQFALSILDWSLAAAVLLPLLPAGRVGPARLVQAFIAAQALGLLSHVPGGLGVFESALLLLLKPSLDARALLPALVVYRFVYYLLPLALALLLLLGDELRQRGPQAARARAVFGAVARQLSPRLLGVFCFLGGALLVFSGATPAADGRLLWLQRFLPLGVVEASHFTGSLAGLGLLLLSQAVARRLDFSYYLTTLLLSVGLLASLLKGADYEEAVALGLLLLLFAPSRPYFDRRAAFFAVPFEPGWLAAILSAVLASVWLGLFAFRHVDYADEMWWQFTFGGEASRFLRASIGVAVGLLVFGVSRLLRAAPPAIEAPDEDALAAAERVIATQSATMPYLALLRDKALLFDAERAAFLMYAVQGRTWVALGDPVGPPARHTALIREFLERCDDHDGTPVFYEVGREGLHRYADFGLTFVKLGEEARVPLAALSLDGGRGKGLRQALRRLEKEGASFRVAQPGEVPGLLPELTAVSDDWLRHKAVAEKGFSLGFFEPRYVQRFPVALVEGGGRLLAFANLWPGPDRRELSVDLMRFRPDAPKGVMESLFACLLVWGRDQGYREFSLGMAPLSGLEGSPVAPFWARMGRMIFERGETFYSFQGLRAFKEKFHPEWEPRYLAYPGGPALARVLADVSALVAGGYRRVFFR